MSNNCLVTKLKGVVYNDNLPYFNEFVVTIKSGYGQIQINSENEVGYVRLLNQDEENYFCGESYATKLPDKFIELQPDTETIIKCHSDGTLKLGIRRSNNILTIMTNMIKNKQIEDFSVLTNIGSLSLKGTDTSGLLNDFCQDLFDNGRKSNYIIFGADEYVTVKTDSGEIKPVLYNGETWWRIVFSNDGYVIYGSQNPGDIIIYDSRIH